MARLRDAANQYVDEETKDIKRARDLMQAGRQTKFSSLELSQIHAMLFRSTAISRSERGSISVGSEGFQHILSHMVPGIAQSPAMLRLFKALDVDNDNKLDFREMTVGLSILAKGTLDEKLELLFRSFDVDNTGYITQAQLESLITSVSSQMDPENPDRYSTMGSGVVGTDPLGSRVVSVDVFVSQVFAQLCNTTGRLSLEQFRQAVITEPRLIQCLMIGGPDQEDVEIKIPTTPPPHQEEQKIVRGGTLRRDTKGSEIYGKTPLTTTTTTTTTTTGPTTTPSDHSLALGVTDADTTTPLLGGTSGGSGNVTTRITATDCCVCVLM